MRIRLAVLAQALRRSAAVAVSHCSSDAHGIIGAGGKLEAVLKAEYVVERSSIRRITPRISSLDLIGSHEDMRIILSEAADTHTDRAVRRKAHDGERVPSSRHALRKIAVGMDLSLIYEHSAGAVHRLDSIILAVYDGGVHIVLIVIPVSRTVPQLLIQDHRSSYFLIAVLAVLGAPKVLENIAQHHSLRQEERKAGSLLIYIKEVKLACRACGGRAS